MTSKLFFELKKICFKGDRCFVYIEEFISRGGAEFQSFIDSYLSIYSKVGQHICINKHGRTFESCMHDTSLSHYFEHAVIQELVDAQDASDDFSYVGCTKFLSETAVSSKLYEVCLNFRDDVSALGAIRRAYAKFLQIISSC